MSLLDLTGRTVLITGGAGAIGVEITRLLAEHGATVIINDILGESEMLERFENQLPSGCVYVRTDITEYRRVSELFARAVDEVGLPDTVLCHAGMTHAAPLAEYPVKVFEQLFGLNVQAAFLVAQEAVRLWQESRCPGHLIFTSSWVHAVPWPGIGPYNASKAALTMLMRSFARELAPTIRANAVAPGIVAVGMAKAQWDNDPGYRARAQRAIPLGKMQTPESVAHAMLFLCSRLADYMTGSTLTVDGGASLYPMDDLPERSEDTR